MVKLPAHAAHEQLRCSSLAVLGMVKQTGFDIEAFASCSSLAVLGMVKQDRICQLQFVGCSSLAVLGMVKHHN